LAKIFNPILSVLFKLNNFSIMNKTELIDAMANEADLTKVDAAKALDAFVKVVGGALSEGQKVTLIGFGSFSVVEKEARKGHNPRTKEAIIIAARKAVKFAPGAELRSKVQ
jgi:DNA-binding protein HU-beta